MKRVGESNDRLTRT